MNRAAKQYLRQVKKNLYCPKHLSREFLRQLEDDISCFCEEQKQAVYGQLLEVFGDPKDVAADFFSGLDARTVSRYSYRRLKVTYSLLAVVLAAALCSVGWKLYEYVQTRVFWEYSQGGEPCTVWHPCYQMHKHEPYVCMPEGAEDCTVFYLRTQHKGRDYYWEYHSCINRFYHSLPMEDWNGSEPYARDFYVIYDGIATHWRFDDKHRGWYKIYDEE